MSENQYWKDTIATGSDSSIYGIMGSPGLIKKLSELYDVARRVAEEFGGSKIPRADAWITDIKTGDGKISGFMFSDEKRRDSGLKVLRAAASMADGTERASGRENDPEPEPVKVPRNDPKPESEPEPEPEPEPVKVPGNDPEPEPVKVPGNDPEPEPVKVPGNDPKPEPEPESKPEPARARPKVVQV